jgi:hypothetical protein|tara:strand:+ start:272 stop:514 length:243 start_codon:yes stop_codon:yes gene_type:complete
LGTFLQSKFASGHLAHAGHGGQDDLSDEDIPSVTEEAGQAGHTGGTICDLRIYLSEFPFPADPCGLYPTPPAGPGGLSLP